MFRVMGKFDGTSKKFGLSFNFTKVNEKWHSAIVAIMAVLRETILTLTTGSQTLKVTCETNNPIAYNLKQLKYHESD